MEDSEREQYQLIISNLRRGKIALEDENEELKELLEGNDGMSVKEIRSQFVDLHREWLHLKAENERLEAAEGIDIS